MRRLTVRFAAASLLTAAFLLTAPATAASPAAAPELTQESMRQAAESFYSIGLDPSRAYPISKARLERGGMVVELEGGSLVLAQPILGRVTGACYSGTARLSLTPPNAPERASLKARFGSEEFKAEVDALYLRFNDSTGVHVGAMAGEGLPADRPATPPDPDMLRRCESVFSSRNAVARKYEEATIGIPINLEVDLLESALSPGLARDFFLAEFEMKEKGWVTFLRRPGREPELTLARFKPLGAYFDPEAWVVWNPPPDPSRELRRRPSVDILHNQMQIVIPDRLSYTIDVLIEWRGAVGLGSARFSMINSFNFFGFSPWDDPQAKQVRVEAVVDEDGRSLPFVHRRHELLVRLPAPLPAGQTGRVRVRALEKTIQQLTPESYALLSTWPWFPQESEFLGGVYTIDWTVKVVKPLRAAGSGTVVREWEERELKLNCAQWKSDRPLAFPSLIFGEFKSTQAEHRSRLDGRRIDVRVHWSPKITLDFELHPNSYYIYSPRKTEVESAGPETHVYMVPASKPHEIGREAARIIDYYEQVLGPYPWNEADVAQMSPFMWFAQAPPGLVQLTGEYFMSSGLVSSVYPGPGAMDFLKTVLAHEVAHHYWGDIVRWKSEEEQWLSESLAEYSSGMFLQAAGSDKEFHAMRNSWRMTAERWEKSLPIIHANRASGQDRWRIRNALLYNKGPLVVHMLRTQLGNNDFVKVLRKVLNDYRGQGIGTSEFQSAAEQVAGYRLDWFFDQWVRGTGIPEARLSYNVTPQAGKYLLTARLTQKDRERPKALFLPLVFHFGKDKRGTKEWRIKSADETLQVLLPEKPERVVVDEFNDLLVKIVYE